LVAVFHPILMMTGSYKLARYTFDLAFNHIIKVGVVSHPSLLKIPEDLEVLHCFIFPSILHSSIFFFFCVPLQLIEICLHFESSSAHQLVHH
jgi:hypothetical protein